MSLPRPGESLPDRLRRDTGDAHARIERDLAWEERLASREAYARWLAGLHAFHLAWEREADALLGPGLAGPRRRAHLAAADLAHLGWDAAAIARLDRCPPLGLAGRAEAFGALYVVEGSSLGGRVIAAEVERRLGFGEAGGCHYFRGEGRRTGALWREVRSELAALPPDAAEAVIGAALRTFEALRAWLCRADHAPPRAAAPRRPGPHPSLRAGAGSAMHRATEAPRRPRRRLP